MDGWTDRDDIPSDNVNLANHFYAWDISLQPTATTPMSDPQTAVLPTNATRPTVQAVLNSTVWFRFAKFNQLKNEAKAVNLISQELRDSFTLLNLESCRIHEQLNNGLVYVKCALIAPSRSNSFTSLVFARSTAIVSSWN